MIVVGMDPGTENFGWCRLEIGENRRIRVIGSGMLTRPVGKAGIGDSGGVEAFMREVREVCDDAGLIVVERYAARGRFGRKATMERVSFMVGVMVGLYGVGRVRLVTASVWKTAITRKYGYSMKKLIGNQHVVDAFCIGAYGGGVVVDARKVVQFFRRKS